MFKKNVLLILILATIGCNDSKKKETNYESSSKNQHIADVKIVNSLGETLNAESRELVEAWPEYKTLDNTINGFYTITSNDALLKAKELSTLTLQLKDSIRIDILDRPDVRIRLNVLHNTALRLTDMETIKTIKNEAVEIEITNILNAFSAINSKINNILNQENLEKELSNFETKNDAIEDIN